ncbi:MAG: ArsA family ATPase [Candidatus Riflebacteria bacterium]|nr:ArsA family ATPase [Candidatus Riflebacteria bacterium]
MRVILFAGKGGVGKTSVAAATGVALARRGYRTLVMSLDPAHSLSDAFDLEGSLVDHYAGTVVKVDQRLSIQEVDVVEEVHRHWKEIHSYLALLLSVSGLDEVLADELAILPGMEEASCLLYINQYVHRKTFDCIVLDCAPTGESLRFISLPSILRWYMDKLYRLERNVAKVARPILRRLTNVPLPGDEYFDNLKELFGKLDGVDRVLANPKVCSVRLVTNPEKMVVRETQRAYVYFCMYGLLVDGIIINRILPGDLKERFFDGWKRTQRRSIGEIEDSFAPVPILPLALRDDEVLGVEALSKLADALYGRTDPASFLFESKPLVFKKRRGVLTMTLTLPFLTAGDVDLKRVEDQLLIRIGSFRRSVALPRGVSPSAAMSVSLEGQELTIRFG